MINFGTPATKGGNGGAITGLVQGMQMAKQESLADDKNQMLKDQLAMTTKNFEFADLERRGEKLNKLMWSAEKSGNYDGVNGFLADKNNANFGGGSINSLDPSQAPRDGDGKLQNLFVNKYKADTGKDYNADNPLLTYTSGEGEGSRFFTPDTFAAGSGYGKYRRDAKLAEDLLAAQIADKMPGEGGSATNRIAQLQNTAKGLGGVSKLPQADQVELQALLKDSKITKENANGQLAQNFSKNWKDLQSGIVAEDSIIEEAIQQQSYAGHNDSQRDENSDMVTNAARVLQTQRELNKALKNDSESGYIEGMRNNIKKQVSSKKFSEMNPQEQQSALKQSMINSKLFKTVFRITKAESGASFTMEEFAQRLSTIAGGDPSQINSQTLKNTFGTYVDEQVKDTQSRIENIYPLYKGDKMFFQNQLNKARRGDAIQGSGTAPNFNTNVTQNETGATGDEAIAEVTKQQTAEAIKTAKTAASGVTDAISDEIVDPAIESIKSTGNDLLQMVGLGQSTKDIEIGEFKKSLEGMDVSQLDKIINSESVTREQRKQARLAKRKLR